MTRPLELGLYPDPHGYYVDLVYWRGSLYEVREIEPRREYL